MHEVLKLATLFFIYIYIIDNDRAIEQVLVTVKHEYIIEYKMQNRERETSIYETMQGPPKAPPPLPILT